MINNFSQWIAHHPKMVVIVCFLLMIPAAIGYLNTGINYDILTYLPKDLNSVKGNQILDETFHSSASSFVILDGTKAKDIVALKEKIAAVDGVSKVLWTDSVLDISVPVTMLPDEVADIFYSKDKNTTMMMVFYSGSGSSGETLAAVAKIKLLLAENQFICGISAISADTKDTVEHDAPIFVVVAVALALFILSFTMGSWALPPIVMISLGVGIVLNMGSNIFMGEVSYITRSIGAILQLGVTMDFSVFLIDRYEEEKLKTPLHRQAMANAIAGTFTSLTGSAMATFFGFIAMCFMSFTLGFDLGIVMAKGVLFGVLSVLTLLPSLMLLFDKLLEKTRHRRLIPRFDKINAFTTKHKRVAALLFFILLIPAFILQNKVDIYYNMDRALAPGSDSIVALHKMKDAFNMATTQFIIVDANLPASDMTAMTESIKNVDGVNAVVSLNSFLGSAIPTSILPEEIKEICVKDNMQLMLINSNYNAATDEENAQIEKLEEIVNTYDKEGYVTGEGAMTKDLVQVNTRDLAVTRIVSIGAIFLVIAICLQSLSIPILLVAAIELAIMINLACSYITGTSIPFIAPTIIECIQLGSTVNYAILLTVRFREEIRGGMPRKEAIRKAANESDRSIIQSAMVFFIATFGVYLVCDMPMIKSICILLARGAIISTVVIIGILTPLLLLLEKFIDKTSLRWSKPKIKKIKTEGIKMKNKKIAEKIIGLTLILALTASFAGCAVKSSAVKSATAGAEASQADLAAVQPTYTAAPKTVKKAETVYVNMDNSGAVTQTTVSDWLHTDAGEVCVNDITDLLEIENVKSDISPICTEGLKLAWNMNTTDLYYRGTSSKKLPVSIDIHYYLNGSEMTAEEIKGQSGDVQIKITFSNNIYETIKIDGKDAKIYNPMVVLGLVILPETQFSGTTIDSGRLIGDGAKEIAVMIGLPGLNETLGLDKLAAVAGLDSMSFSNTFTISAKASAFTLGNLYFTAVPLSTVASDIEMPNSIGDLKGDLVKLKKLESMVQTIDPNELLSTLLSDSSKITELTGVIDDALTLYDENKKLLEMLPKYFTKENMDALQELLTTMNSSDVQDMLELLKSPVLQNFITVLPTLTDQLDAVTPMIEGLEQDMQDPEVAAAIENLPETLDKLDKIQKTVDDNQDLINALTTLTSGENMEKLDDLMNTLSDSDLIGKLGQYGALTDDAAGILGRLQAMIDFGNKYKIFTQAPDNMQTSVMFIFNTPSIR